MGGFPIDPFWTLALALLIEAVVGRPKWLARLFDTAAGVPAAFLIALASAFSPGASPARAFATLAGGLAQWPLAGLAGAFRLSFEAGASWLGDGKARLEAADLRRCLYLFAVAGLVHAAAWVAFGVLTLE